MKTQSVTFDVPVDDSGNLVIPVRKIGTDRLVPLAAIPVEQLANLFMYGVVQKNNDTHSQIEYRTEATKKGPAFTEAELKTAAEHVNAAMDKMWDAIMSGEWRVRGPAAESADPVTREATRLAREDVRKAVVARKAVNKHAPSWKEIDDDKKDAATAKQFAANEAGYRKQAEAILAARKAASADVDLADLI